MKIYCRLLTMIIDDYGIDESKILLATVSRAVPNIRFQLDPDELRRIAANQDAPIETENHSSSEDAAVLHHATAIDGVEFIAVEVVKESKDGPANES